MKKYLKKNQKGFTLIEIIAVLIILGILATVAIGKFMDLQAQAQTKAIDGAIAEGMSACNICFGKLALSNGTAPASSLVAGCANGPGKPESTDFSYTFTAGNGGVTVLANHAGWSKSNSKFWTNPNGS